MSFTESQYDDIAKSLRESAGTLGKIAQKLNSAHPSTTGSPAVKKQKTKYEKEAERYQRKHHTGKNIEHMSRSLKVLSGDIESVSHSFDLLLKVLPAGAALGGLIGFSKNLINTWRNMAKEGQTFNGSMFKMAAAAGEAGLPLDKFAEIVKKNSKAMATFGQADVSRVMKNVRDLAAESGNYGMTIEDLSQVTGDYLEIQRLAGNRQAVSNKQTAKSAADFAQTLASLSVATGKNRDLIEQETMQIMSDVAITTKDFGGNSKAQQAFLDSTMQAVATMASINGEGGKVLADMVAKAAGYGTSLFSEGAKMFIEAGMGDMVGAMDQVGAAMSKGSDAAADASADALIRLKHEAADNLSSLRLQAQTGNKSAEQVLEIYSQLDGMSDEQIRRMKKNQAAVDNFTKFMTALGGKLQEIFGHVWATLMNQLGNIDKNMDDFLDSKTFQNLETVFDDLAIKLANWFRDQDVKTWADNIGSAVKTFIDVMTMAGHAMKMLVDGLKLLSSGFDIFAGRGKGSFYAVVTAAVLAMFAPQIIISGLKGLFAKIAPRFAEFFGIMRGQTTRRMNVAAGVVNVNGAGGGGGNNPLDMLDDEGGHGGAKWSKSRLARANALRSGRRLGLKGAELEAHVAEQMAKKGIGRRALSYLGSKIPGKGLLGMTARYGGMALGEGVSHLGGIPGVGAVGRWGGAGVRMGGAALKKSGLASLWRLQKPWMSKIGNIGLKKGAGAIPILGALAAGGMGAWDEYQNSHNILKSLFVGAGTGGGSLAGEAGGAIAGTAVMPGVGTAVGEAAGGIAGGMAGGAGAGWLYDTLFGQKGGKGGLLGSSMKLAMDAIVPGFAVMQAAPMIAQEMSKLTKSLTDHKQAQETDKHIATMAEHQKDVKGLMEQLTAISSQGNELLKRIMKSNKDIAQNT